MPVRAVCKVDSFLRQHRLGVFRVTGFREYIYRTKLTGIAAEFLIAGGLAVPGSNVMSEPAEMCIEVLAFDGYYIVCGSTAVRRFYVDSDRGFAAGQGDFVLYAGLHRHPIHG